jgi:hypothetical protein
LFGKPDGRRPLGRPRRRWNIEINPKEISVKGRFILAEKWSWLVVVLNTEINLKFNKN